MRIFRTHALLSLALLKRAFDEAFQACEDHGITKTLVVAGSQIQLPLTARNIALASLVCSIGSIVFGVVFKTMQVMTNNLTREGARPVSRRGKRASMVDAVVRLQEQGFTAQQLLDRTENDETDDSAALEIGGAE